MKPHVGSQVGEGGLSHVTLAGISVAGTFAGLPQKVIHIHLPWNQKEYD
jgi:hypothetical protein